MLKSIFIYYVVNLPGDYNIIKKKNQNLEKNIS